MLSPRFRFATIATLTILVVSRCRAADSVFVVQPGESVQAAADGAPQGSVLELARGTHHGPVTITRCLTLRGQPGAVLRGTGTGSVLIIKAEGASVETLEISGSGYDLSTDDAGVQVLGNRVTLKGLRLRENLHGIYVRRATGIHVTDCEVIGLAAEHAELPLQESHEAHLADGIHHNPPSTQSLMGNGIHLFNARGASVIGNHVHHVRDGIYVAHTREAVFRDNRVHDSRYGIHYMYSSRNRIEGNELWRNVAGPALMFSRELVVSGNRLHDHGGFRAYGLLLQDIDLSRFADNVIVGNRVGLRLQSSNGNELIGNRIAGNLSGMTLDASSRDNVFSRNVFGFNLHQMELTGPTPPAEWAPDGVGNYWQGAMPLDLNGDRVAEWPHHEVDLMGPLRERFLPAQLLIGSPGIRALEWALRRAPTPKLRHITDPHPLTQELLR